MALTPQFVVDLETRMQTISEREYARMTANLWWQAITKTKTSTGKKEIMSWLLSTAMIKDLGAGGKMLFDDLVARYTEIENKYSGAGLKLTKAQLEDTFNGIVGGEGMDLAGEWSSQIGSYMGYWPQKQVAHLLKNGHTAALYTGYDAKAFFASDHPVNPFNDAAGTFRNLFTGAAAGDFPGACPIDDSVTTEVALVNMGKIFAYIASIKMPNGEDPRFLRPKALIVPPRMMPRAVQLTGAKFLPQVAGGGAGSADVDALIKALGYATPTMADELAGFEDNTTFFVAAEQASSNELGAVIYQVREPFAINFYGVQDQVTLSRADELEWHAKGRNAVAPGHPYLLFKCKAA